jgi:secreted trypsin-like serine protease
MIARKPLWILGCVGVLTVGCSQAAPSNDPVDQSESSIINGVETTGYSNIIALYGKKPGADKGMLCTASVIAPKVLLTAAHCVSPAVVGEGLVYKALLAPNLMDSANPSPKIDVAEVHWDQAFNAQALPNGHDIAVAILAEPINVAPLKFNRAPLSGVTTARLVGYGLNDGVNQTGAGVKRTAEVPVASVDDKFVVTGSWFGTTMCSGDSGGPVLANVNGEDVIVGVNSFGFMYCVGTGSSTRVDTYASFVDQYLDR